MRKIIAFLLALCLLIPAAVSADTSKELRKALNKEKKEKLKEYKKGGWKLFGSSRTLEVALLTHTLFSVFRSEWRTVVAKVAWAATPKAASVLAFTGAPRVTW